MRNINFRLRLFPLISWQVYFAPVFASQNIEIPIPKATLVQKSSIGSLLNTASSSLNVDYTDASNWYPGSPLSDKAAAVSNYNISIPKINIENAEISTVDTDLTRHMIEFNTGTTPPMKGNSIVFGHSTLPSYMTPIITKQYLPIPINWGLGDIIFVSVGGKRYTYKVKSVIVVEPEDTSILAQDFSGSYLTLITCTPPGTIWKRLVIKSKLEKN